MKKITLPCMLYMYDANIYLSRFSGCTANYINIIIKNISNKTCLRQIRLKKWQNQQKKLYKWTKSLILLMIWKNNLYCSAAHFASSTTNAALQSGDH